MKTLIFAGILLIATVQSKLDPVSPFPGFSAGIGALKTIPSLPKCHAQTKDWTHFGGHGRKEIQHAPKDRVHQLGQQMLG
ncbi:UNKNOWN [Stylonychia lemnae]|uniref:Uncharacterized protein n=1 Tax=Stylonychia lemnae TaxID=5949 RepID=A0A078AMD7_STYLE|nr:UNKNOWN [Stylonychia lemnae]|eukprot:CDW83339.1 UNKNOWN [Stylonychia lemnae]